ncbi:MAG: SAM-dependent methyltransferase [Planctomycetota bacterium]
MTSNRTGKFVSLTCAHGAEKAIKSAMSDEGWRLAFSRPGLVTAKHDDADAARPKGAFIRSQFESLGQCRGNDFKAMSDDVLRCIGEFFDPLDASPANTSSTEKGVRELAGDDGVWQHLHVWPKDRAPIGKFDFEPGVDEVSQVVADALRDVLGDRIREEKPNQVASSGESVFDVVLCEPGHWVFGHHVAESALTNIHSSWPGGVQPISPKYEPISRAYYKAAESLQWSSFDIQPGDLAVEVGSAPGGACGRLLELGLEVIGVDPAEMDPRILKHPRFTHLRGRAGDFPRREFRGAKWMMVDSNVRPDKTLVTVKNLVLNEQTSFRGLLLTMKLGHYDRLDRLDRWRSEIESWGVAKSINVKQLARNKCEVCYAVKL